MSERFIAAPCVERGRRCAESVVISASRWREVAGLSVVAAYDATLEPLLVGEISGTFHVPAYQRGYRWGAVEVRRLLDDIWESKDEPYYLQPVVVKRRGDEWELVDGQQRLTTLFLVFQYMQGANLQNMGANYSLTYETRAGSAAYLAELDAARSGENIDFFHIHQAHECIRTWFEEHGARQQYAANKFYNALFEHVRVIWYEVGGDVDAVELFTRLNVGRIPLTDAELVKALLLSRSRDGGLTDRALEIAAQWDGIERDLRKPELWAFITGMASQEPTHISLLLDTIAGGPTGRDRPLYHTFEMVKQEITDTPQAFWDQVVDLHSLVMWWYESHDLFHKIGFLTAHSVSFKTLVADYQCSSGDASQAKTKSEFAAGLSEQIRNKLALSEASLRDLVYPSEKAGQVLLLMNVETVRQRDNPSERYSFHEHAAGHWTLEHIHAQNAEQLNRAEQWEQWLRLHRREVAALNEKGQIDAGALLTQVDQVLAVPGITATKFRPLEQQIVDLLSDAGDTVEDVDSLSNLTLLDRKANSALGNSVFAVKRAEVLKRDRLGAYIPVCTRNVFLKYYSPADEHHMHCWSARDREHYLNQMVSVLRGYLQEEGAEQ